MSQSQDSLNASLLNQARVGVLSRDDICLLLECLNFEASEVDNDVHLYALRSDIAEYNAMKLAKLSSHVENIPTIYYFEHFAGGEVPADFVTFDEQNMGGLPRVLYISSGAREMLIRNIQTDHGLVNGAMGHVHSFEYTAL